MDFVETQEITPFELKSMKSSKQGLEGSSKQELFDFFPVPLTPPRQTIDIKIHLFPM
jgi:hypothetical protein